MSTFADRFWNRVRGYEPVFWLFFVADVLFLVLALVAYPLVESGSAAHVLIVLDLFIFVVLLILLTYLLYQCRKRRAEEEQL
ncbi:hypothetical protein [Natrinema sp. SYSU A 869]|uniref:hypothetical protein n=1 Tax=Natrinema sp. SYSU A 869 TaxID=2871694 RepID=UPI001CA43A5E|nr:hypothetical protein [Natrinema sp. SYSU A 869]